MTKHLRLLIVSGLIFSFIYPHTIYFTVEVDGEIVDRVVKDVEYLGIKDSKVYYRIKTGIAPFNKYITVNTNCKDVYQIIDNDDEVLYVDIFEVMEFSCSDSTYDPKIGNKNGLWTQWYDKLISENEERKKQAINEIFFLSLLGYCSVMLLFFGWVF